MERWSILMHKEYFKFSCAHFLIFPDGSKERLHGHNYQVSCEIAGDLTDRGLVIDFKLAKPVIRALCDELDEHWIIPDQHPDLNYTHHQDGHTDVHYKDCHYRAPTDEIIVLPANNTSAENLATYIGRRAREQIEKQFGRSQIHHMRLTVSETSGQHGVYEYNDDSRAD